MNFGNVMNIFLNYWHFIVKMYNEETNRQLICLNKFIFIFSQMVDFLLWYFCRFFFECSVIINQSCLQGNGDTFSDVNWSRQIIVFGTFWKGSFTGMWTCIWKKAYQRDLFCPHPLSPSPVSFCSVDSPRCWIAGTCLSQCFPSTPLLSFTSSVPAQTTLTFRTTRLRNRGWQITMAPNWLQ